MTDMEHMRMRWVPMLEEGRWKIFTAEDEPWYVARIPIGLYGDDTGNKTAHAICDEHNAALKDTPHA